jgi:uncharacterized membrane protein
VIGLVYASAVAVGEMRRSRQVRDGGRSHDAPSGDEVFRAYRRRLGRAILLGLEVLVAADIIRTVAISPTFENVAVLGLIVLIRTFLSFSLEVEIDGRWPWHPRR